MFNARVRLTTSRKLFDDGSPLKSAFSEWLDEVSVLRQKGKTSTKTASTVGTKLSKRS